MPTPHLSAAVGDIAPLVLLPGDPRRAERMAADMLADAAVVSDVRGIKAFTGTFQGQPLSVLASGMGVPSVCIYATELYRFFGVQRIVRVGTCGAMSDAVAVRDIVIASAAHTNSSVARLLVPDVSVSLAPTFGLLRAAVDASADVADVAVHVGPVYCSDHFYLARPDITGPLEAMGTLGVEMESAGLYATALIEGKEALTVLTASDHLKDPSADMSAEERETSFHAMAMIAATALVS